MNQSVVQRPPWYQGDRLPKSRAIETKSFKELSGHVLDEIIAEKISRRHRRRRQVRGSRRVEIGAEG